LKIDNNSKWQYIQKEENYLKIKIQDKKVYGSLFILCIFIIFLIVGYKVSNVNKPVNNQDIFEEEAIEDKNKGGNIVVYVNGEIKNPGVYTLKENSRVENVIKAAGGFTEKADKEKINLAKKLKDEDYILISKRVDELSNNTSNKETKPKEEPSSKEPDKVNLNTATKEELKTIPGVGDVTAQRIVDYREEKGSFSSIEELKNVERIGDKTFEKIKEYVDVM